MAPGSARRTPSRPSVAALALGVSTLELDVHLTRDNDVVVSHDPALADARLIRQLTRADLPPTMPLLREVAALLPSAAADPSASISRSSTTPWRPPS